MKFKSKVYNNFYVMKTFIFIPESNVVNKNLINL
jgi:hypothetical protein